MAPLPNEHYPDALQHHEIGADYALFHSYNGVMLRIEIITDHVMQVRYSAKGYFSPDFSYALAPEHRSGFSQFVQREEADYICLETPKMRCEIAKQNLKLRFYGEEGKLLNDDEKGFHWEENPQEGNNIVKMSKRSLTGEHYFGLGDKATNLNLRDKRFQNWGTDEYGFAKEADPLYRNIPFYYGLHRDGCYGIFFDNSYRSFFDFAAERKNVTSFWAEGGEINYYFIAGSSLLNIGQRYLRLTGKPELPPLWSLGYHQCKWSYRSETEVMDIARQLREHRIPADAIYLDIDYMDGFRCFTWDKEQFPEPKKMVAELKEQGFKTVAIIDPGIKIDPQYSVYKEAFEKGYFCTHADGPLYRGKVWPGDCHFPDFTKPEVREWWADLYHSLIGDIGLAGIWNDMNEPAVMEVPTKTFPLDIRHDYDGHPCSHRKAHNVYGMQMSRASYEGVKKFAHPQRPFIITRSTYAGGQRYSSVWTGDNIATWEHLWVANVQCQRLSISGFSFVGSDIGGFTEHPTMELFVRWMQLAVFHPLMRNHSSGDHSEQEPWSFGDEATDLVRQAIQMRYRLLPYHYSAFYQYVRHEQPILRPLAFFDQEDPQTWFRQDEFVFGDHLLVCPILEPNSRGRRMYIPRGQWYHYHTDHLYQGGKEQFVEATLADIPVFVQAGAIIPQAPDQQYSQEKPREDRQLHVYFGERKTESFLYEDAGDGYGYRQDQYLLRHFNVLPNQHKYRINQHREGRYEVAYQNFEIVLHGFPQKQFKIEVDGLAAPDTAISSEGEPGRFRFRISPNFQQLSIRWD